MEEDERMNFNSFVDAYNAYQNPNLAPVAPAFGGYGYQAPQLNMVQAPNQLPQMSINPDAIYDPTVAAAMQILNRPMMMAQTPNLLGSGTDYQQQFGLLADIAPTRMQQYQRMADPTPAGLMDYMGGGGGDAHGGYGYDGMGDIERSNIGIPSTQFKDSIYDYGNEIDMSNRGIPGTQFEGSIYDYANPSFDTNYSTSYMGYDPSQGGPGGVGGQ